MITTTTDQLLSPNPLCGFYYWSRQARLCLRPCPHCRGGWYGRLLPRPQLVFLWRRRGTRYEHCHSSSDISSHLPGFLRGLELRRFLSLLLGLLLLRLVLQQRLLLLLPHLLLMTTKTLLLLLTLISFCRSRRWEACVLRPLHRQTTVRHDGGYRQPKLVCVAFPHDLLYPRPGLCCHPQDCHRRRRFHHLSAAVL